jgi:ATP-dependent Clp protease protease subunit
MTKDISLPLPPVPNHPSKVPDWIELFRAHVEAKRLNAELAKIGSDLECAETARVKAIAERTNLDGAVRRAEIETMRSAIELDQLVRSEQNSAAQADRAMVYAFYKDVNDDSVAEAVKTLDEWSRRNPGSAIEVQLTSPGGYVLDGLALFDFLRSLSARGHKIIVTVLGFAASMGAVLLQAGDERRIGANSFVMIHEVGSGAYGKVAELEDQLKFTRRLQERLVKLLCSRSSLTSAEVHEMWKKKDVWLDAREAKKLGLVDKIIS